MNKKQTENKIAESFAAARPDVFDNVAAQCPDRVPAKTRKSNVTGWKFATCALALVLVIAVVLGGVGYSTTKGALNDLQASIGGGKVTASVTLDVNPSVAIRLNDNMRVVSVDALNLDGKKIIGNMDFGGAQLEVTVNALIGSMLRNGKLSEEANSVLVSVESSSQNIYEELSKAVSDQIAAILNESNIQAGVVSQRLDDSSDASSLAEQYGISAGKAQLINKIMQSAPAGKYTVEQLVSLKINDLNLILDGLDMPQDDLVQNGSASDSKYAGRDAAITAALDIVKAGLTQNDVQRLTCKMDFDDGRMVYEVEFVYDQREYEVEINAADGTVLSVESEMQNVRPDQTELDEEQIKGKAFDAAGVPSADRDAIDVTVERERDDGVTEYELKFSYNGKYYEFEIDGYGNVRSASQKEIGGEYNSELTREQIQSKILEAVVKDRRFASVTLSTTYEWEIEMDVERGRQVYEAEFKWGRYEFDCTLDAASGSVTFEAEIDD